jgi:HSP20 family molecular chaperone IbpA
MNYFAITFAVNAHSLCRPMPLRLGSCLRATPDRSRARAEPLERLAQCYGFDRKFSMLDQLGGVDGSVPSYPPYNIARATEYAYRISVAVAGFTDADLSVETKENRLTIHGEKSRPTTRKRPARCSTRASPRRRRRRLRQGQGREPGEQAPTCRPRARDFGGEEEGSEIDKRAPLVRRPINLGGLTHDAWKKLPCFFRRRR